MGDRLQAGIPPWYVTKPTKSTQPCIPLGSLNRVPALIGWGKGRNVTCARWQVTLSDPIWHVSSRSGAVLVAQTAIRFLTLPYFITSCFYSMPIQRVLDYWCLRADGNVHWLVLSGVQKFMQIKLENPCNPIDMHTHTSSAFDRLHDAGLWPFNLMPHILEVLVHNS